MLGDRGCLRESNLYYPLAINMTLKNPCIIMRGVKRTVILLGIYICLHIGLYIYMCVCVYMYPRVCARFVWNWCLAQIRYWYQHLPKNGNTLPIVLISETRWGIWHIRCDTPRGPRSAARASGSDPSRRWSPGRSTPGSWLRYLGSLTDREKVAMKLSPRASWMNLGSCFGVCEVGCESGTKAKVLALIGPWISWKLTNEKMKLSVHQWLRPGHKRGGTRSCISSQTQSRWWSGETSKAWECILNIPDIISELTKKSKEKGTKLNLLTTVALVFSGKGYGLSPLTRNNHLSHIIWHKLGQAMWQTHGENILFQYQDVSQNTWAWLPNCLPGSK